MDRCSDPTYDQEPTFFPSFSLGPPPDMVTPFLVSRLCVHVVTTLHCVRQQLQGFGQLRLSNLLPLAGGAGLDPAVELFVMDKLTIHEHSTLVSS